MIFMQKGFATLEIIFATMIIAILMGAAIPNVARVIDRVALDYETKKLYTDLRFLQSLNRMTNMKDTHFGTTDDNPINLIVYPERYIFKRNYPNKIYDEHYFSSGVVSGNNRIGLRTITFDDMGKIKLLVNGKRETSYTLNLISRLGTRYEKKTAIIIDSVGRFRGGRE